MSKKYYQHMLQTNNKTIVFNKLFLTNKTGVLSLGFIIIAVVLVYYRSLFNGLIDWDDYEYIINNKFLYKLSWENIQAIYQSDKHITLSLLTIAAQIKLTGLNPFYFHFFNLIIHCINIFLVYFLTKKLSKNAVITIIVTVLFALHPTRVESVAWIMERKDLLYTMFYLLSLIAYVFYVEGKTKKTYLIIMVIALGWLSSISKIQAFTLPIVLFLLDYYYGRKLSILSILEKIILMIMMLYFPTVQLQIHFIFWFNPYLFSLLVLIVFTNNPLSDYLGVLYVKLDLFHKLFSAIKKHIVIRKNDSFFKKTMISLALIIATLFILIIVMNFLDTIFNFLIEKNISSLTYFLTDGSNRISYISDFNFVDRIFLFSYSVIFYIYQFFNSFNLCAMHPYPLKVDGHLPIEYYGSGALLLLIVLSVIILLVRKKTNRKIIIFGSLFFLINVFIVGHIFPLQGRIVTADRYSYLAYFGLFLLVGFFINKLVEKRNLVINRMILFAFVLLLSGYSVYSFSRVGVWKNTNTFWSDVVKKQPDNYYAYYGVGNYQIEQHNYEQAIMDFTKSVALNDKDPVVYNNLGRAYNSVKKYDDAIKNFSKAIELQPDFSQFYNNRGNAYYYLKDFEKAMSDYKTSIAKWNKNTDALINKGDLEVELDQKDSALADYKICIKIDSNNALPFERLGVLYAKFNISDSAIFYLKKSLSINPDFTKAKDALEFVESKPSKSSNTGIPIKNKNNSENFVNQGLIKAKANDFTSAIELFNKAITEDSLNATAYKNRGNAKAALKDYKGSIEDFNVAIRIDPKDGGAYLNRGISKFHLDDKTACEDWKKAEQLGSKRAGDLLLNHCK